MDKRILLTEEEAESIYKYLRLISSSTLDLAGNISPHMHYSMGELEEVMKLIKKCV